MLFHIAGINVEPWIPPLIAFIISFFTSMGGVSGAILLLPFQMSVLGYTAPSVSATNQLFNIVAIPSGVYRYWQEGRMVWPLTWIMVAGTLPGVFIGAIIRIKYLPDPKHFKIFAAVLLLYIGIRMIRDLLGDNSGSQTKSQSEKKYQKMVKRYRNKGEGLGESGPASSSVVKLNYFNLRRLGYSFYDEKFDVPTMGIFSLSLIVGTIGGIYGIGGGAIIAPFLVTFFGLPVYTIAGAVLMGTFITSASGVVFYQVIAPFYPNMLIAPDWLLGVLFGLGGMAGMYLGARFQKHVPETVIKGVFVGIIVFTGLKYSIEAL